VIREVQATIPPRVEYTLTPLGARIAAKLREMADLLEGGMPTVTQARERYDAARTDTG
jgi:DNA-binding HxlR family transcriptional regulator